MGNILTDNGAPYAVAIAIGAVGWLVTTSVGELKQANITEYTVQKRIIGAESYVDINIHNRSLSKSISTGKFTFRCSGSVNADCFWNGDPVITATPLKGVSYRSDIDRAGPIYRADARLAPQSSVRYSIRTTSPDSEILMLYEPPDDDEIKSENLVFRQGASWEGWLIGNYLTSLIYILFALVVTLFLWVLASAYSMLLGWIRPRPSEAKEPNTLKIILARSKRTDV